MHDHHETPEDLEALAKAKQLRYENRDFDWDKVGKFMTVFFVFSAICFALSFVALWAVQSFLAGSKRPVPQAIISKPNNIPERAPLQDNVSAWKDMSDLRKKEMKDMQRYGSVEGKAGYFQIPVDRAVEIMSSKPKGGMQ